MVEVYTVFSVCPSRSLFLYVVIIFNYDFLYPLLLLRCLNDSLPKDMGCLPERKICYLAFLYPTTVASIVLLSFELHGYRSLNDVSAVSVLLLCEL